MRPRVPPLVGIVSRLRHPVRMAPAVALMPATAAGGVVTDPSSADSPGRASESASLQAAPRASRQGGGEARPGQAPTLVAAGDIACDPQNAMFNDGRGQGNWCLAAKTERLIRRLDPTAVLVLGDSQYDDGRYTAFQRSYDDSWGRQRYRTYAAVGNHEYGIDGARGYFKYFGRHAGRDGQGWYSFDLGVWHMVALNSNCTWVGCGRGSSQYRWLKQDLAESTAACSVAFMHHPIASSGPHGDDDSGADPLWRLLYRAGVDVILGGHDHIYERFAPLRPDGDRDTATGMRQFIVGTGGAQLYGIEKERPYSEVRSTDTFGVLRLELRRASYSWRFVPIDDDAFTDQGIGYCHQAPA